MLLLSQHLELLLFLFSHSVKDLNHLLRGILIVMFRVMYVRLNLSKFTHFDLKFLINHYLVDD